MATINGEIYIYMFEGWASTPGWSKWAATFKASDWRLIGEHTICWHSCYTREPQPNSYSYITFQNNSSSAQEPRLRMISQECPDRVFFNSRKSDLEGRVLPRVSSCMFCALGSKLFYKHRREPITKAYSHCNFVYARHQINNYYQI